MSQYISRYQTWIPVLARVIFGLMFLQGAYYKILMFDMEVAMTGAAGFPLPTIAVSLAFVLEVVGGVALIIGWRTRLLAFLLAGFVLILNFVFFRNIADQNTFAFFVSNLGLMAGLFYVSSYGPGPLSFDERRPVSAPTMGTMGMRSTM